MNTLQLIARAVGEKIALVYARLKTHTAEKNIHRTSAEIRAEITDADIPAGIARDEDMRRQLAGKTDKVPGKELMPSPGAQPLGNHFLNEQGEYIRIEAGSVILDMQMGADASTFTVSRKQLSEYVERAIIGGEPGLNVYFKHQGRPFSYKCYKVTDITFEYTTYWLTAYTNRQSEDQAEKDMVRHFTYSFIYDATQPEPLLPNKGVVIDSPYYITTYIDRALGGKADAGTVKTHLDNTAIHRTSAEIRADITDADIPPSIARDAEVDAKISVHNDAGNVHPGLRNSIANLENGATPAGRSEYAQKLGDTNGSYTKTQLDTCLSGLIRDVTYDSATAKFTFWFPDGHTIEIDTPLENTVKDGRYDTATASLVLVLVSGQEISIPAAGLTKIYTGKDTPTATTTVSAAGEIAVALKQGTIDSVHLSSALQTAINSHLTLTGDTRDNIATFADQPTRVNLASGDKHTLLFGKIKRWFSDLGELAFLNKVSKADMDAALQGELNGKLSKGSIIKVHQTQESNYSYLKSEDAALNISKMYIGTCYGYNTPVDAIEIMNGNVNVPKELSVKENKVWHSGNFNPATKEPVFTKNTAFNKNFGTVAGTVCQGNDARLSDSRPANGGNADTVDGKRAADFVYKTDKAIVYMGEAAGNIDTTTKPGVYGINTDHHPLAGSPFSYGSLVVMNAEGVGGGGNPIIQVFYSATGSVLSRIKWLNSWTPLKSVSDGGNADTVNGKRASDLFVSARESIQMSNINNFVSRESGTYQVNYGGGTDLLTVFYGGGSSSALEILHNYSMASGAIKVRSTIDRNRYSPWKALAFVSDIPASLPASGGNADTVGGIGATSLMRKYMITVGGDSSHLYPCTWTEGGTSVYMSIHSPSLWGGDAYNQNEITFLMSSNGWSDMPKKFMCLEHGVYQPSEITIHSIYQGLGNGMNCIYLRGGAYYTVFSNTTLTPNSSPVTSGIEIFGVMNNDGTVSTTNATRAWSYTEGVSWLGKYGTQTMQGNLTLDTSNASYVSLNRNNESVAYMGLGSTTKKDLLFQLYQSGNLIRIGEDGKNYSNNKEIATVDQIPTNIVTTDTAQTISGAKTFTAYCDFRAGGGNSGSDMRFKKEVTPVGNILTDLLNLDVIQYSWDKEGETRRNTFGLSASQLLEKGGVFGKIVHERGDEGATQWVEYDRVGVLALKGLQEIARKTEDENAILRQELNSLREEMAALREHVQSLKNIILR